MKASTAEITPGTVYLGIDVGGTNCKIVVLAEQDLNMEPAVRHQVVVINREEYHLYAYSTSEEGQFREFIQRVGSLLKGQIRVAGTGGGAVREAEYLGKVFQQQIKQVNQFQAHGKGLEFYKQAELPISLESYLQDSFCDIKVTKKEGTLRECRELLFMSLGSGVNFQLYGEEGEGSGIRRQKAKDVRLTAGDGYFLEGTCLGAGFLMGLGRLSTGQSDYSTLLLRMKKQDELRDYYEAVLMNLFQMGINLSMLHQRQYLLISGALLSYHADITELFKRAMKYSHIPQPLAVVVVRLTRLEGYLGALGALQTLVE